ncbi:ULK kinase [Cardiosporidium cionae]|uniref:ULK kinase n=1 Tax=Cardiosporidium cionae TaxID=476202 RepID=A0ABQ7J732_9APIC|nr:ULK kinase [Cardiosporidium cionae]|eukprot:KAF8819806.1 ULK kinase [Cardiosporidium cionae]
MLYSLQIIHGHKSQGASMNRTREEINIMRTLKCEHPYVVHMLDSYQYQNDDGSWCAKIILDFCEGGDLYDYINEHGPYSEDEARLVIYKMVHAIAFVHNKKIIHRDLKPENILLQTRDSNGTDIRISDFGVAKKSLDNTRIPRTYQMFLRAHSEQAQIDMWSLGVLSYVVLCGGLPFHDRDKSTLYQQIVERDIQYMLSGNSTWKNVTRGAQRFVEDLLVMNPSNRLTAVEALNHRWLRGALPLQEREMLPSLDANSERERVAKLTKILPISKSNTDDIRNDSRRSDDNPKLLSHPTKFKKLSVLSRKKGELREKGATKPSHLSSMAKISPTFASHASITEFAEHGDKSLPAKLHIERERPTSKNQINSALLKFQKNYINPVAQAPEFSLSNSFSQQYYSSPGNNEISSIHPRECCADGQQKIEYPLHDDKHRLIPNQVSQWFSATAKSAINQNETRNTANYNANYLKNFPNGCRVQKATSIHTSH